jgi:hypothetical protein
LQKLKLFLIGSGFFWIFAWSVFGSILSAKINLIIVSGVDSAWLIGLQKSLLTAAHSHMNNMAITTILFGLTISQIDGLISKLIIKLVCLINLISIPFFGLGLLLEAFYPPVSGHFSVFTAFSAFGGVLYLLTVAVWSSFFIFSYVKRV